MISCSLSVISDFVAVFLAGPLEWKDHPEFNLKWGEKTLTNDVLQATAFIYQSLLLISFQIAQHHNVSLLNLAR